MKKKLLSAVVKLAIGLIAVTLVSYWWFSDAWFSENKTIKSDGISLSAMVPLNIYISGDSELDGVLTFPLSDLDALGFKNSYFLDEDIVLRPASSNDGKTFWYAKKINPDGEAIFDYPSQSTYALVTPQDLAYYEEKTFYISTTTQEYDDVESLDCYISQVLIEGVSNKELYKSARISITANENLPNEKTVIYRYSLNLNDTDGQAIPALDADNKASIDPSVAMGNYVFSQEGALPINLNCLQNGQVSVKALTVRIWFEGENSFAERALAGGGFTFDIKLSVVDPALGD